MATNSSHGEAIIAIFEALTADPRAQKIAEAVAAIVKMSLPEDELASCLHVYAKLLHARKAAAVEPVPVWEKSARVIRELVSQLIARQALSSENLHIFLDHETRQVLHSNAQTDENKKLERRLRTRSFYTQKNFNIYWEESEGYAKLITFLHSCSSLCAIDGGPARHATEDAVKQLMSIIGLFKLDISRVIEAILKLAAHCLTLERDPPSIGGGPDNSCLHDPHTLGLRDIRLPSLVCTLLDEFERAHVAKVLGVILTLLDSDPASSYFSDVVGHSGFQNLSRESYLLLVVVMIREQRVPFDLMWPYLSKEPGYLQERFQTFENAAKSLAHSGTEIRRAFEVVEQPLPNFADPWHIITSDRDIFFLEPLVEEGPFHKAPCHALDVLYLTIRRCRWEDAKVLLAAINGNCEGNLDVAAHPPIAKALINLAFSMLKPALYKHFPQFYSNGPKHEEALRNLGGAEQGFVTAVTSKKELFADTGPGSTLIDILLLLGPHARRSVPLLYAICRLVGDEDLSKNQIANTLMKEVLLSSLQLTQSNCALSNMLWSVLSRSSHETRWDLYGYLRHEAPKYCAAVSVAASRASYETKSIMKRVTSDSCYKFQGAMAKISHGQAMTVFSVFIRRIQGYPPDRQTITPFVETLKSCTYLSLDMLMYLIVFHLGDEMRSKIKDDGYNYESWFASSSLLVGIFLRKIKVSGQTLDASLHFLLRKIAVDDDMTLISVLKDIVLCTTEIDVARSLTTRQQKAKSGGRTLRSVVQGNLDSITRNSEIGTIIDVRKERECNSAMLSLKSAFLATGHHFNIAIAIAQFATRGAFHAENKRLPLKMNGGMQDRLRSVLHQFAEMLDGLSRLEDRSSRSSDDLWAPFRKVDLAQLKKLHLLPADWYAIVRPILKYPDGLKISADLTKDEESMLSSEFYRAFWALNLADLEVPDDLYVSEIDRFQKAIAKWEDEISLLTRRGEYHMHKTKRGRGESELKRFRRIDDALYNERQASHGRVDHVSSTLRSRANEFDAGAISKPESFRTDAMLLFLQKCVMPRALASAADALYCAKFIRAVTKLKILALDLPILVRSAVQVTPGVLLSSTEGDAANFGVLLREFLTMLESLRSNKGVFEKSSEHGFRDSEGQPWRHDLFCNYTYELHQYLAGAVCKLLSSTEYLHSRNALTILHLLSTVFPKVREHGAMIIEAVRIVTKSDKADLRLAATGILTALQTGEGKRIPLHIFRLRVKSSGSAHASSSLANTAKLEPKPVVKPETRPIPIVGSTAPVPHVQVSQALSPSSVANGKQGPVPMEVVKVEQKEIDTNLEQKQEPSPIDTKSRPSPSEGASAVQTNGITKRPRTPDKALSSSPNKRICPRDREFERSKDRDERNRDRNDKNPEGEDRSLEDRGRGRDDRNRGDRNRGDRGRDERGRTDRNRNDRSRDREDRNRGRSSIGDRVGNDTVRDRDRSGAGVRDRNRENTGNALRDRHATNDSRTPDRLPGGPGLRGSDSTRPLSGNRKPLEGSDSRPIRQSDGNMRGRERPGNTNPRHSADGLPSRREDNERIANTERRVQGHSPLERGRPSGDAARDGGASRERFGVAGRDRNNGPFRNGENGPLRPRNNGALRDRGNGGLRDRDGGGRRDRDSRVSGPRDRHTGGHRGRDISGPRVRDNGGGRDRNDDAPRDRGNADVRDRNVGAPRDRNGGDMRDRGNSMPRDHGHIREGAPMRDRENGGSRERGPIRDRAGPQDNDRMIRDRPARDREMHDRNMLEHDRFSGRPGGPPMNGNVPEWRRTGDHEERFRNVRDDIRHPPMDRRRSDGGFPPDNTNERDDRPDRRAQGDDLRRRPAPPIRRRRNTRQGRR